MKWLRVIGFQCLWLCGGTATAQSIDSAALSLSPTVDLSLAHRLEVDTTPTPQSAMTRSDLLDEGPSLVPPMLTLAVGVVTTALGVGLGVAPTIGCHDRCEAWPWSSGLVVSGVAVIIAGLVWREWVVDERYQLRVHRRMMHGETLAISTPTRWSF